MDKLKSIIIKTNWSRVYVVLEYITAVYAVLTGGLNLLNLAGITSFEKWMMQPTFWGESLLIFLLLHNSLVVPQNHDVRIMKLRPYVTGVLALGVVTTCNVPLILLLFLILGCILMTGFGTKFNLKICTLCALVACAGVEVYSVAILLNKNTLPIGGRFLNSVWLDVLFTLVTIIYCVINKEDEIIEGDIREAKKNGKIKTLRDKWSAKMPNYSKLIARYIGGGICVLSLGLFLFYFVSTTAGANKIVNGSEEVYLLQHCEDKSLVLTMVEDKENDAYKVTFEKYNGTNNQKLRIYHRDDELYQLVFVENDYALEITIEEETGAYILGLSPMNDSFEQLWLKQDFLPKENMYKFLCAYSIPLSYQMISQATEVPKVVVQADTGGYEFFTVEQTTSDEFVTKMVSNHGEEFKPTLLMETVIGYLGGWSLVVFLVIVLMMCVMLYSYRAFGDEFVILYAIVFVFMLFYASLWAIALFSIVYLLLFVQAYLQKAEEQRIAAFKQYNENMADTVKAEMQASLGQMEKSLQEIRELLK